MPVVSIADIGQHAGEEITLQGWLYNQRESGKLLFPQFRDGTGLIQGVVSLKESARRFRGAERSDTGIERRNLPEKFAPTSAHPADLRWTSRK